MTRRFMAVFAALLLLAAACGGDAATEDTTQDSAVPDVVGETADFARGLLEANGFVADVVEVEEAGAEPGTVFEQVPAAGASAEAGSTVVLKVAAAPAATTTTTAATTTSSGGGSGGGGGTTSTTSGGGGGGGTTPTSVTTTTSGSQQAPDDGGDGSQGSPPEHSITVVAENNNPESTVFFGEISYPGDRGDGIHIKVDNLFQGTNQDAADVSILFICTPGGPKVKTSPAGYSGGSDCDNTYNTVVFAGYQSNTKTYYIYLPDGVEGYFQYQLSVTAVRG